MLINTDEPMQVRFLDGTTTQVEKVFETDTLSVVVKGDNFIASFDTSSGRLEGHSNPLAFTSEASLENYRLIDLQLTPEELAMVYVAVGNIGCPYKAGKGLSSTVFGKLIDASGIDSAEIPDFSGLRCLEGHMEYKDGAAEFIKEFADKVDTKC